MLKRLLLLAALSLTGIASPHAASAQANTWTDRSPEMTGLNQNAYITSLAYGGGRFMATTHYGQVAHSAAGTSHWTVSYPPSSGGLFARGGAAYGNGTFVVVKEGGRIWTAPPAVDGSGHLTYTARGANASPANAAVRAVDLNSVAFVNGLFVVVPAPQAGGTPFTEILTSPDGITWTSHQFTTDVTGGAAIQLGGAVFRPGAQAGQGSYLFPLGRNSTGNNRIAIVAEDFSSLALHVVDASSGAINALAYAPAPADRLVAVTGSGRVYSVTGSPAGVWTQQVLPASTASLDAVYFDPAAGYMAVGATVTGSSPAKPAIFMSSDGTTWTAPVTVPASNSKLTSVSYADGLWLAGGNQARLLLTSGSSSVSAPEFSVQPQAVNGSAGQTFTLTAEASGSPAPTYRWYKDNVALSDEGRFSGTGTAELTVTGASLTDAGFYYAAATNTVATVNSTQVRVRLNAEANGAVFSLFGTTNSSAGSLAHEASPPMASQQSSLGYFIPGQGNNYISNTTINGVYYNTIADLNDDGTKALVNPPYSQGNLPPRVFEVATGDSVAYPALPLPWEGIHAVNWMQGVAFAENGNYVGQLSISEYRDEGNNLVNLPASKMLRAFFYDASTETYTLLEAFEDGDVPSNPAGLTADGLTVAGYERDGLFNHPFIWTKAGGHMVLPNAAAFAANGDVRAISPNGRYITGLAGAIGGQGFSGTTGLRWDRGAGLGAPVATALSRPHGMNSADAFTVTDDGTAGGFFGPGNQFYTHRACVWLPDGTRVALAEYLATRYNLQTPGYTLHYVTGISPDRRVLIGTASNDVTTNGEAWMLQLPEPLSLPEGGQVTVFNSGTQTYLADGGTVDFGNRDLGAFWTVRLVVQNGGGEELGNLSAALSGDHAADFTVTSAALPGSLAPDATAFIDVRFTPAAAGARNAVLTITSNDPDQPSFEVLLAGSGLAELQAQTITFNPLPDRLTTASPFALTATASSELAVAYQVVSGPASVAGSTVTLTGEPGVVTLRATQAGNGTYAAAAPVEQSFNVSEPDPGEEDGPLVIASLQQTYNGLPRPVTVSGGPAGGNVVVTYKGSTTAPTEAGTYPVVAAVEGTKIRKTGRLVIAKAPLSVVVDNQVRFAGQPNPELTFSYAGFVNGETAETALTKQPKISTTAREKSPGGTYPIRASGAVAKNYAVTYENGSLLVESFTGKYEALLARLDDQRPAAKLELNVAKNGVSFTGKLTAADEAGALPVKGSLEVDAEARTASTTVSLRSKKSGKAYSLILSLPLNEDFTVSMAVDEVASALATSGRLLFTPARGQVISYAGAHTLLLAPGVPAAEGADYPKGSGYATAVIDKKAVLKIAGKLADGTSFTASLAPDAEAEYRLFAQPYRRASSYLAGRIGLEEHPDNEDLALVSAQSDTRLAWTKAGLAKDKSYAEGFGVLDSQITLDPWARPVKARGASPATTLASLLGLEAEGDFDVLHGPIASPGAAELPAGLQLDPVKNTITVTDPATNTTRWTMKLNVTKGTYTGSFVLTDSASRKVPFAGVLRQAPSTDASGVIGGGSFLLPGLPTDTPRQISSGELRFAKPVPDEGL